jgi:hypothetical protein
LATWDIIAVNIFLLFLLLGFVATLLAGYRWGWLVAPIYLWLMTLVYLGQQFVVSGYWYAWNPLLFIVSQGVEALIITAMFSLAACLSGLLLLMIGYVLPQKSGGSLLS